jgi:hypothetical protein
LYVPAGSEPKTQVNSVWVELEPAIGPELLEQVVTAPVKVQDAVPPGAVAPVIPVTVAVKVIVPPYTAFDGELTTTTAAVALVTVTDCAEVVGKDE